MTGSQLAEVDDTELAPMAWELGDASDATDTQAKGWTWRDVDVRVQEATTLQAELMASVAHDLQAPLASVIGFTELLLTRDFDAKTRQHCLQTIAGELRRLGRMIDGLLETQPEQQAGVTLSRVLFDLSQLLTERVELFRAQSEAHELHLALVLPALPVRADRERIASVIDNLLSNAIKYSPDGGTVVVEAATHHGRVRVAVHDEGLGIPAEQQHLVFGRFFRTETSRASGIKGRGLGLARCREIVQSHGGAIGFDSNAGEGSRFWFELPRVRW